MKKLLLSLIVTVFLSVMILVGQVKDQKDMSAASPNSVWAAVSAGRPIFIVGDKVDITFAAVNDTKLPLRYDSVRSGGVLVINGQELQDSYFIFGNGPREVEEFLQPGKACIFSYQLTDLFKNPGDYEVVWKGQGFQTRPLVFRVVKAF